RRGKPLRHRDALLLLFQGGENHCEIGMLFLSFFKEGCRRSRRGGWCGFTPTPPPACGRPLLMRGGENDCELGMLFPSFFQGGVSAKPTGWLVWIYPHTTPRPAADPSS